MSGAAPKSGNVVERNVENGKYIIFTRCDTSCVGTGSETLGAAWCVGAKRYQIGIGLSFERVRNQSHSNFPSIQVA